MMILVRLWCTANAFLLFLSLTAKSAYRYCALCTHHYCDRFALNGCMDIGTAIQKYDNVATFFLLCNNNINEVIVVHISKLARCPYFQLTALNRADKDRDISIVRPQPLPKECLQNVRQFVRRHSTRDQ